MDNSQLLITFTNRKKLNSTLNIIKNTYNFSKNKIFILSNEDNKNEIICSYNIDINDNKINNYKSIIKNTITVHRKKATNTLYTINALNYLISALNDGNLDKKFSIDWENYKNCILVIYKGVFRKIKTRLIAIKQF